MTEDFGTMSDGRAVTRVTIGTGPLTVRLLDLGALIQDVRLHGVDHPLTLGGADVAAYEGVMSHFGAIMGPVVNRITNARAEVGGIVRRFEANQDGKHTRHGGNAGAHRKVWEIADRGADHVAFTVTLPDGEGGFTGTRRLTARYAVEDAALRMVLEAESDASTLMNLANHGYWTLHDQPTWEGHELTVHAERYLPTTDENLPTGEIAGVADTPYDFRAPRRLDDSTPKLDTNFCLADAPRELLPAVRLRGPTHLTLDIATTAPGVQVFDMGTIDTGHAATIHGRPYRPRAALAFEPQMWPDAPGRARWPDIVLRPGEAFRQETTYAFLRP